MTDVSRLDPVWDAVIAHIATLTNTDLSDLDDTASRAGRVLRDLRAIAILAGYGDPFGRTGAARHCQAYLDTRRTTRRHKELNP